MVQRCWKTFLTYLFIYLFLNDIAIALETILTYIECLGGSWGRCGNTHQQFIYFSTTMPLLGSGMLTLYSLPSHSFHNRETAWYLPTPKSMKSVHLQSIIFVPAFFPFSCLSITSCVSLCDQHHPHILQCIKITSKPVSPPSHLALPCFQLQQEFQLASFLLRVSLFLIHSESIVEQSYEPIFSITFPPNLLPSAVSASKHLQFPST